MRYPLSLASTNFDEETQGCFVDLHLLGKLALKKDTHTFKTKRKTMTIILQADLKEGKKKTVTLQVAQNVPNMVLKMQQNFFFKLVPFFFGAKNRAG